MPRPPATRRGDVTKVVGAWLLLAAILGACGTLANPSTDPADSRPPRAVELEYSCGTGRFTADTIAQPARDEQEGHPSAAALRAFLVTPHQDIDWLPLEGWRLVHRDATTAAYVARVPGDPPFVSVGLELVGTAWKAGGWGQCRPELVLQENAGVATFRVAAPVPAGARRFTALVTERACASGRPAAGRIVGPAIIYHPDRVEMAFGVRPLAGGQTCQGNPETPVEVVLEEPLGNRGLFDASLFPPRDATEALP